MMDSCRVCIECHLLNACYNEHVKTAVTPHVAQYRPKRIVNDTVNRYRKVCFSPVVYIDCVSVN